MKSRVNDLNIELLLHDHAQSSEDARYRDRLIMQAFYISLVALAALIDALVRIWDKIEFCLAVSFIGFAIFFIFSASVKSIKGSRDAAWRRRGDIEKEPQLIDLVKINKSIVERSKRDWWEKLHVGNLIWRFEFFTFISWALILIAFIFRHFGIGWD